MALSYGTYAQLFALKPLEIRSKALAAYDFEQNTFVCFCFELVTSLLNFIVSLGTILGTRKKEGGNPPLSVKTYEQY